MDWLSTPDQGVSQGPFELLGSIGVEIITNMDTPLPSGYVKTKVDGVVSTLTSTCSYSFICRDEFGNFMGASSITCLGVIDPVVLETLACREPLALANDLMRERVQIASDRKGVVEEIKNISGGHHGNIICRRGSPCVAFKPSKSDVYSYKHSEVIKSSMLFSKKNLVLDTPWPYFFFDLQL
jgi:hypothetical protein